MTDIEIAQAARPLPITEVAAKAGIDERFVECYGRTKAKIDPALLSATGGIVQGMSGSPILQNGKLVGAVTHVLVNDPTMGYGVLIENMLDAGK